MSEDMRVDGAQTRPGDVGRFYLEGARREFRRLKLLAEKCFDQMRSNEHFHAMLDAESNSIATLMRHLAGNMISRWTDFLSTDGEKPERNRDVEFEPKPGETRESLLKAWDRGWERLFQTMGELRQEDLLKTVRIRSEPHFVMEAIQRQLIHAAYHVGQIVYMAKHLESPTWQSLSIPRGRSAEYYRKGSYLQKDLGEGSE